MQGMRSEMELETERLRVIALDRDNLIRCRVSRKLMEKNLELNITHCVIDRETEDDLKIALEMMIHLVEEDEENYLWNTNWEIVLKEKNRIIGGFCFQGCPNTNGEVQIGYIMQEEFRGRGYTTEVLKKMVEWALAQEGVKWVVAETEKDNIPSSRVLEKIGMEKHRETENTFWWRINRRRFKEFIK